ncbi:hypothetical protein G6011_10250 [Alternaria panax]|uniref:Uncharacterized protein n=1 Tax=Alternaria panax TaxID=48097 RepID=A0AAD4IB91_9PLEO|nr:hypothetical protein G6011_10250 [Alternaria panax]
MSPLLSLPVPLPSDSITLGQLLTNLLNPSSSSLKLSVSPAPQQLSNQSKEQDAHARFHVTIDEPSRVFDSLRHDPATQAFLCKMSQQSKPVYFVTGLQTSKAPCHKRAAVSHEPITEAASTPQPQLHLPFRRVDSASNIASSSSLAKSESTECVLAVQLLKVRCRVGAINEPHCISDVNYVWSYHLLEDDDEEDLQLSIGLGTAVEEHEWKTLAGVSEKREERRADHDWSYDYEDSDDGLGGF